MTTLDAQLAEKRRALCDQMQMQRQRMALQLVSTDGADFPRSMTMRLVMRRPLMLGRLALGLLRLWRWHRQSRAQGRNGYSLGSS